jgi:hypothetical protein
MQTIQITLSDSPLEQAVLRLAEQHPLNFQEVVTAILEFYAEKAEDDELNALADSRLEDGQSLVKVTLDEL